MGLRIVIQLEYILAVNYCMVFFVVSELILIVVLWLFIFRVNLWIIEFSQSTYFLQEFILEYEIFDLVWDARRLLIKSSVVDMQGD